MLKKLIRLEKMENLKLVFGTAQMEKTVVIFTVSHLNQNQQVES